MSVRGLLYLGFSALVAGTVCVNPPALRAQALVEQGQSGGTAVKLATVKGTIADTTGAVIPGATVTLTSGSGKATIVQSQSDGTYTFTGVRPGTYSETVTMLGFASFVKLNLRIAPGQALLIDAKMAIQEQSQQVNVNATGTTLSTDSDSNASSTVIKGKDLEALSDDPDELSSELTALAGPSAGPNGGQIYVDGFTGGQLPPKSSIREIRINQNPFSAQYDRVGYGRVEVFTKPGTDKLHVYFQTNGNANFFNTSNPFLGSVPQLPYHTIFLLGNITGPINSKASFTLGGSHRVIQDDEVFYSSLVTEPGSTDLCPPGTGGCTVSGKVAIPTLFPQVRTDFTPRADFQLTEKNTLTVRYQFETNSQINDGISGQSLPSTGYNLDATENTLQLVDTQIFSDKLINETRFEYQRDLSTQAPLTVAPTVEVQGAFTGGGSSTQTINDHQDHFEVQNYTSLAPAKHFIRIGGRLRTTRDANYSNSQSLGIFNYENTGAYSAGTPSQYIVAKIAQPSVHATLGDLGLYAEDDWKAKPNLTVSYGIRFEAENHIPDHHDFAPRVSFAYGLGSKKGTPQTVVRGGFGIFYDRFSLANVITTEQENGVNQQLYTVPQSDLPTTCTPTAQSTCLNNVTANGTASGQTTYTIDPRLHSPYLMQAAIGVDEQLGKIGTISINYLNMRGVHEFNSNNLTAPVPEADGTIPPVPAGTPNEYQFASQGVFRQNQLNISPHINYGRSISLWGYYGLNFAKADSSGSGSFPSVVGNLKADYGRASFDTRSRLFLGGNFALPHRVSISPFMVASSGTPFNIITGQDLNGDGILSNDRPAFASASTLPANLVVTSHGSFDVDPAPGVPRIPVNYGTGPAAFTLNLRITKAIGFGPELASKTPAGQGPSGPPPPGGGGRGGGGGGRGGGGGGPFGGGGANSGRKYSLSLGVLANNVFNDVDRGTPDGVVSSLQFYQSTQLAGGIFSTNSAVRRITLQATFSF